MTSSVLVMVGLFLGGQSPTAGVLGSRAIVCSGGIDRAGELEELHCI